MMRAAQLMSATRHRSTRLFATLTRPTSITPQERAALRAARRERGQKVLQQQQQQQQGGAAAATGGTASPARPSIFMSRWIWYAGVGIPTALIAWGISDEDSPPARFSDMIGLTDFIMGFASEIQKPSHDKLLPDWSQVS